MKNLRRHLVQAIDKMAVAVKAKKGKM